MQAYCARMVPNRNPKWWDTRAERLCLEPLAGGPEIWRCPVHGEQVYEPSNQANAVRQSAAPAQKEGGVPFEEQQCPNHFGTA